MRNLNNLQLSAFWGLFSSHRPAGDIWKICILRTKPGSLVYMRITDGNCPTACMVELVSGFRVEANHLLTAVLFCLCRWGSVAASSDSHLHGKDANTSKETWWMAGGALGRRAELMSAANFFSLSPWETQAPGSSLWACPALLIETGYWRRSKLFIILV